MKSRPAPLSPPPVYALSGVVVEAPVVVVLQTVDRRGSPVAPRVTALDSLVAPASRQIGQREGRD